MAKKKWLHYPQRIEATKEEEEFGLRRLYESHFFIHVWRTTWPILIKISDNTQSDHIQNKMNDFDIERMALLQASKYLVTKPVALQHWLRRQRNYLNLYCGLPVKH